MHLPLTINGQGFGAEHITVPTGLAKQTNKGHWYPNWRFEIYYKQKYLCKLYHNLIHKSGNIVFINTGYSDNELKGIGMLVKYFNLFDVYTITNESSCYQPINEIQQAYESVGVKFLSIETNITRCVGPVLDQLPKKVMIMGEQENGYSINVTGGFQTYSSYYKGYIDPYQRYSEYKQFVLEGKKQWKDLLLTKEEIDFHTGFHTKPRKNQPYKF